MQEASDTCVIYTVGSVLSELVTRVSLYFINSVAVKKVVVVTTQQKPLGLAVLRCFKGDHQV